jgi:hypothetical protein
MPKVVTPLNLDFDEKEEFIKLFGEGSLSKFVRQCIHERLEQKNREAGIDLSAIHQAFDPGNTITVMVVNESLDRFIEHADSCNDLTELAAIEGKGLTLVQKCRARHKRVRFGF